MPLEQNKHRLNEKSSLVDPLDAHVNQSGNVHLNVSCLMNFKINAYLI